MLPWSHTVVLGGTLTRHRTRLAAALATAAVLLAACGDGKGPSSGATVSFEVKGEGASLTDAVKVLRARLASLGMAPDDGVVTGGTVTFRVSRTAEPEEKATVARRGHLTFRPVLQTKPRNDAGLDCTSRDVREEHGTEHGGPDDDGRQVLACDADGEAQYVLAPVAMSGPDVAKADAVESGSAGTNAAWIVALEMRDGKAWAALTERLVGAQLAIVLDGVVQTAPTVNETIPDGRAEISGSFTERSAKALAAVLKSGALPVEATPR